MSISSERYRSSINRNLHEVCAALMEHKIWIKLGEFNSREGIYIRGESFFNISCKALFNDMFAHTIKVLDKNGQSATFWYLFRTNQAKIRKLKYYSLEKIENLRNLSKKLIIIRNEAHFHIDKKGVLDPKAVWTKAGITEKELRENLLFLHSILIELYEIEFKKSFLYCIEDYDTKDLDEILRYSKIKNLI